jgi:hypothetical protein
MRTVLVGSGAREAGDDWERKNIQQVLRYLPIKLRAIEDLGGQTGSITSLKDANNFLLTFPDLRLLKQVAQNYWLEAHEEYERKRLIKGDNMPLPK